jgi:hypothetical protein
MSLDLNKLETELDKALSNETTESLNKFLNDKRMTNIKQHHVGKSNKMIGVVDWLEQEFLKLESTVGVQGVFYELLERAKPIERQRIENAYDDAVQDMRQDEERPFKGSEYYDNNFLTPKQAIGRNFDVDAQEIFQGD